jgi:hypothetical protein
MRCWLHGGRRRRALLALTVALSAVIGVVSVAFAGGPGGPGTPSAPSPPPTPVQTPAGPVPPDTEVTPVAKDGCGVSWRQVAGAVFPGAGDACGYSPSGSPVPVTTDLFAVRFARSNEGLAGGAACASNLPAGASGPALDSFLGSCARVPTLFSYAEPHGPPGDWSMVALPGGAGDPSGSPRPGFIGAIAWISRDRALAVGGDGAYPRTEPAAGAADPDGTGHARAWLYDHGGWCELGPGSPCGRLPAGMSGLTAVDCTPRPLSDHEFCVAGGYRQLWMWHDGRFTRSYSDHSSPDEVVAAPGDDPTDTSNPGDTNLLGGPPSGQTGPSEFRFRVRAIRFTPGDTPPKAQVVAVTSGCCDSDPLASAKVLEFTGDKWLIQRPELCPAPRQTLPDSFFALTITKNGGPPQMSILATPGGSSTSGPPPPASRVLGKLGVHGGDDWGAYSSGANGETGSTFCAGNAVNYETAPEGFAPDDTSGDLARETLHPDLSDLHLVAGDGDLFGPSVPGVGFSTHLVGEPPSDAPDSFMDWAVGAFTSTMPDHGAGQAGAFTTTRSGTLTPMPLDCPSGSGIENTGLDPTCRPDVSSASEQTKSESAFSLSSYALNGLATVGSTGVSWAVGDRGAVVRLGGQQAQGGASTEPSAPLLGSAQAGSLADTSAYDAFTGSPAGPAGVLPSLAVRPLERLGEPRWVAAGIPVRGSTTPPDEGVSTFVMSRDGSDGWALGPRPDTSGRLTTAYRFDGQAWRRCDIDGVPGISAADPACSALSALRHHSDSQGAHPVPIYTATRIPMENGSDPSRASDFEAIAAGGAYRPPPGDPRRVVILRFSRGRWAVDEQAMAEVDPTAQDPDAPVSLAFVAPDDGWLTLGGPGTAKLFHFDGRHWSDCRAHPESCGDPSGELPLPADGTVITPPTVVGVGRRVYFAGERPGAAGGNLTLGLTEQRAPVILHRDPGGSWTDRDGGLDPLFDDPTDAKPGDQGSVAAISVVRQPDGHYAGWAAGVFGASGRVGDSAAHLMRLGTDGKWSTWSQPDAASEYLSGGACRSQQARTQRAPGHVAEPPHRRPSQLGRRRGRGARRRGGFR